MRIFLAVRHAQNPRHYYGGLWAENFLPALHELGHEVIESQVDLAPLSAHMGKASLPPHSAVATLRERLSAQIVDEVKQAHRRQPLDLFLSYFYVSHFLPAAVAEIRGLGIPTVNYFCNSIHQFHLVAGLAPAYQYSWHAEMDAAEHYRAIGANPVWVQMAADPALYRPVAGVERERSVCFVGQRYADRDRWLAALAAARVPLAIYGRGWQPAEDATSARSAADGPTADRVTGYRAALARNVADHGVVGGAARNVRQAIYALRGQQLRRRLEPFARGRAADLAQTFSSHAIVLGLSNVWADGRAGSRLIPHVRLREFEAPMSGAFYLTGYTPEIEHFYKVGEEIETYRTRGELVDKARYYLDHPAAAERIRQAGYARARRDHTWVERFKQLFNLIGLPERGA